MHVLHFLPVYAPAWQFGGPILSVSRLCEGLSEQGVAVRVITTNAGLPEFPINQLGVPQNVNGVQVFYYPVDKNQGVIRSKALVDALPEHTSWADLLHLSSIWQPLGLPVQKAAHAAGLPVIQTLRGALGPYSWTQGLYKKIVYYILFERHYLQRAALLHCTTSQEARELEWLRLKPPIRLLPNPLDLSQMRCDANLRAHYRAKLGIPNDEPLLLVAGRLHHKKGLDLLPHVLKSVSHQPWHILFVGNDDDGTGSSLKLQLSRLGLSDRMHWPGSLSPGKLVGPYNAADWLLLPSRHENFGNVVIEALACGCGVLISDHVGVAEMISSCPGVTVIERSSPSWIASILDALSSSRPGKLSHDWVFNYFSKSYIANQAKQMYSSLL